MNVNLAIDHGTTNSLIAVMDHEGPQVLTHAADDPLFPSCIFIYADRRALVGKPARQAIVEEAQRGDGQRFYKPRIATSDPFPFPKASIVKNARELAADVFAGLLARARRELGRNITAAVITVPAMFDQAKSDATRDAAALAGLEYCPLLPEPVAAATAYGFDAERNRDETWMVFDLGGGTLDVSLVMVRDGGIESPAGAQLGDNQCGGGFWDKEIAEWTVAQLEKKRKYSLSRFRKNRDTPEWMRLELACEDAKIRLSTVQSTTIVLDDPLCVDDNGREVHLEEPIDRAILEKLISPYVARAIATASDLLRRQRKDPKEVSRLILVGGPTKMPFVQERLRALRIPVEAAIDPMTVVVRGAAIHAASLKWQPEVPEDGSVRIEIEAPTTSIEPIILVMGRVHGHPRPSTLAVQIERADGGWSSARTPLDEEGVFELPVDLIPTNSSKPVRSAFAVEVVDERSHRVATTEFEVWCPMRPPDSVQPTPLLVVLKGNRTDELIPAGRSLPSRSTKNYATSATVKAPTIEMLKDAVRAALDRLQSTTEARGISSLTATEIERLQRDFFAVEQYPASGPIGSGTRELREQLGALLARCEQITAQANGRDRGGFATPLDVLRIAVVEGIPDILNEVPTAADACIPVGELIIPATQFETDLPAGSEVELDLNVDESRKVTLNAHITRTGAEFEARLSTGSHGITVEEAQRKFDDLASRLAAIRKRHNKRPGFEVTEYLDRLQETEFEEETRRALQHGASNDRALAERGIMNTLILQGSVWNMEQLQAPARVDEALMEWESLLMTLDGVIDDDESQTRIAEFRDDARGLSADNIPGYAELLERIVQGDQGARTQGVIEMALQLASIQHALQNREPDVLLRLMQGGMTVFVEQSAFVSARIEEGPEKTETSSLEPAADRFRTIKGWFPDHKWSEMKGNFLRSIGAGDGGGDGESGTGGLRVELEELKKAIGTKH